MLTVLEENTVPRSRCKVIILVISVNQVLNSSCEMGFIKSYGLSLNILKQTAEIII